MKIDSVGINRKYVNLTKKKWKKKKIEMIVICCSHKSETPNRNVSSTNKNRQKINLEILPVYLRFENKKFGKLQI